MQLSPLQRTKTALRDILLRDGIRQAVIFMNGLVEHRFTALYRFGQDTLHTLYFYDREHPACETSADVPLTATYCVRVRDTRSALQIVDAPNDPRLVGHPSRQVVQAYCGVPLVDEGGRMFGSVCHFDLRPKGSTVADIELMEHVGHLIHEHDRLLAASGYAGNEPGKRLFFRT